MCLNDPNDPCEHRAAFVFRFYHNLSRWTVSPLSASFKTFIVLLWFKSVSGLNGKLHLQQMKQFNTHSRNITQYKWMGQTADNNGGGETSSPFTEQIAVG